MKTLKTVAKLIRFLFNLLVLVVEILIWTLAIFWGTSVRLKDIVRACRSLDGDNLTCSHCHSPIPLFGGPFECEACGFRYHGSILECGNPECRASTPYVTCPSCGASNRSPWRWGR